jgi:hypothetical protein
MPNTVDLGMKTRSMALVTTMIFFIVGCGDPYYSEYTKAKPNSQNFVGVWLLTDNKSGKKLVSTPRITFNGDGTFLAQNYPEIALGEYLSGSASVDGEGTWSIEPHQDFWVLRMGWKKGLNLNYSGMLCILRNNPPYVLHSTIGDPDLGEVLVFKKRGN